MEENTDLLSLLESKMPGLSKGQKCVANFLLNHYGKAVYLTAAKLGETTGVSESTVVRFAIELGFDGYPGFQKALETLVKNKLTAAERVELSSGRLGKSRKHLLESTLEGDASRILETLRLIDSDAFDRSAEQVAEARRVYVIGGRSSSMLAGFLAFYLNLIRDEVININTTTSAEIFEQIFRISKDDVCIGISFPRYSQRTIKAMAYAVAQGATVIAITDSTGSPIAQAAQYKLIAQSDMVSFMDSLAAPMSVINALLAAVSEKKKGEVMNNLDTLETLWREYDVYSEKGKP